MYIGSIGVINNAAFNTMQNNDSILGMTRNAGNGSFGDMKAMQQAEKQLQMSNLQNKLTYLAASTMEDSQKKLEKENIERSFSTFA